MSEKKQNLSCIATCTESSPSTSLHEKKLLQCIEQWSQDENCGDEPQPLTNGHSQGRFVKDSAVSLNGLTKTHFSKNNNLVEEEQNLGCPVDKCNYYKNFTLKVNNNIYSEPLNQKKDGMEEYFLLNAKTKESLSPTNNSYPKQTHYPNGNSSYYSQINALNRDYDEEDDDSAGCIYTYKGDNYESNLSHMFDTCHSCGLPTIARHIRPQGSTSNPLSQSTPQNNLYSPEMDFLEMDFDPGSNGDGPDSECEDNNVMSIDPSLVEAQTKLPGINPIEENSISPYICPQCEQSVLNDEKLNNLAGNHSTPSENTSVKTSFASSSKYDIEKNSFVDELVESRNLHVKSESEQIHLNNENNLDVDQDSSDESGDADDERDESLSEKLLKQVNRKTSSFHFTLHQKKGSKGHQNSVQSGEQNLEESLYEHVVNAIPVSKATANSHVGEETKESKTKPNNDLGSVSAPEVSPTKEFSSLEKLTRSLSFHNQLSGPSYENLSSDAPGMINCTEFERYEISSDSDPCHWENRPNSGIPKSKELSNIQVCSDRLHQRLLSVFNIGSDQSEQWTGACNETKQTNKPENGLSQCSLVNIPNNIGKSSTNQQNPTENLDSQGHNSDLPLKIIGSKSESSSKDTNLDYSIDQVSCEPTTQMEKVMIWTEPQASYRQITQLGTSACGPTAVMNVLLALDHAVPVSSVTNSIKARLRAEKSPLVDYLFSRGNAGTTHEDLIRGVEELSQSAITSRFFHMYPKRSFQLSRWLAYWIKKGGVPVATLNLQVAVDPRRQLPDAWHHQMVFGVGPRGVYLTNPLDCESDSLLSEQLCSESILLVRRSDIVQRWNKKDQLIHLALHSDSRWNEMNVLGQVVGVLKEHNSPETPQGRRHLTSHVAIPASYQSGVTIFMRSDNSSCEDLRMAKELPLLNEDH